MRDDVNSLQETCKPQNDQIPSTDCEMTKKSYETPTWRRITTFLDHSQRLGKWDDVLSDRSFWRLDWSETHGDLIDLLETWLILQDIHNFQKHDGTYFQTTTSEHITGNLCLILLRVWLIWYQVVSIKICVWSSLECGQSDIKSCPFKSVLDPLSYFANLKSACVCMFGRSSHGALLGLTACTGFWIACGASLSRV